MFLVESGERPEGRRRLSDKKVSNFFNKLAPHSG
jgi:hypothetical protein